MSDRSKESIDVGGILACLGHHKVDFVLIGGLAGVAHGSSYPSFDVDVAYARDRSNLDHVVMALRQLDATLRIGGEAADAELPFQLEARTLENGMNFTFRTRLGPLDLLGDPGGAGSYARLREEAATVRVDGVDVRVASLDHLIAMKSAAGRAKDRLMVEEYIALADEQSRPS